MKKTEKSKLYLTYIILFFIFAFIFVLNIYTPLLADDYSYSFGLNGKIKSLFDIIENQIHHYLTWGGRSVAHTIGQIFLMFPKMIFSIFNSFMYTILIYLIYMFIKIDNQKASPFFMVIIHLLIWFVAPAFGQNCLWLIGSCNYLWTTVVILCFIYQYIKNDKLKDRWSTIVVMFLLGVLSGWTNENTAAGTIVIITAILGYNKYNKKNLFKWNLSGLMGLVLGFIVMIAAPGNFVRSDQFEDNSFILIKLVKRFIEATQGMFNYMLPIIIMIIILVSIIVYNKKKIDHKPVIFFIGSICTIYAMCLSPTFPERAWFGIIVFATISVMYLLNEVISYERIIKYIVTDLVIITFIFFGKTYITTFLEIRNLHSVWIDRIAKIEKAKKNNKSEVRLNKYVTNNRHNPAYDLADITDQYDVWPNTSISKYYKIKKVIGKDS